MPVQKKIHATKKKKRQKMIKWQELNAVDKSFVLRFYGNKNCGTRGCCSCPLAVEHIGWIGCIDSARRLYCEYQQEVQEIEDILLGDKA